MKSKNVIELRDVWEIYQVGKVQVNALRGMYFTVKKGEFVAIQGPSGSGKSTAMNLVGCLDLPSKGKVLLEGKDISKMSESNLAQIRGKKIGFIFQQFNLIPSLTALENVTLPMTFQNIGKDKREKRAMELLKLVNLEGRMNHRPSEMSGGEQQRVAIARALANNPDIILADEPTGNLDSKTGKEIVDILLILHEKEKKTIVMVTHDDRLAKCAHRIVHIKDGRII